ncbi:hypothetical protein ACFLXD_06655, partial [Chloroflexota bacterium]
RRQLRASKNRRNPAEMEEVEEKPGSIANSMIDIGTETDIWIGKKGMPLQLVSKGPISTTIA